MKYKAKTASNDSLEFDPQKIRENLSSTLEKNLKKAIETIGNCNVSSEDEENGKTNALPIYSSVTDVFTTIKELMDTYPNHIFKILGGEFEAYLGKFPLYLFLDMLLAICQNSDMPISNDDLPNYLQIIEKTKKVPISLEFANLHINPRFIKLLGANPTFHFDKCCDKQSCYNCLTGERKAYISTVGTYNYLHYGTSVESNGSPNGILNNDTDTYPELVCKPIHTIEITNTREKYEPWKDDMPNIHGPREVIPTYLTCAIFIEEEAELIRRYEKVIEYVNQVKLARWQKDFKDNALPLFQDQTFETFEVVPLPWDSSENGQNCYAHLKAFYDAAQLYMNTKGMSVDEVMNSLEFFETLTQQINGILFYNSRIKEDLIMRLLNIYVTILGTPEQISRTGNMPPEEFSNKLAQLSIADLCSCIASTKKNHERTKTKKTNCY